MLSRAPAVSGKLLAECVAKGIVRGNSELEKWCGEWVCERGNTEFLLSRGVATEINERKSLLGVHWITPELKSTGGNGDFAYVKTEWNRDNSKERKRWFGHSTRFDIGLWSDEATISSLVELKCHWKTDAKTLQPSVPDDLRRLAKAMELYPCDQSNNGGVRLSSVLFGAFVWQEPGNGSFHNQPLEGQCDSILQVFERWCRLDEFGSSVREIPTVAAVAKPIAEATPTIDASWRQGAVCVGWCVAD